MAEVLAPAFQQTGSMTMLHSPADAFQNTSPQTHHQPSRSAQMPRTHVYNVQNGGMGYRGTSSTPVAPYAFQATPQLRQENRTSSAPTNPYAANAAAQSSGARLGHPTHASSSSDSTVSSSGSSNRSMVPQKGSKDDTAVLAQQRPRSSDEQLKRTVLDNRPLSTISLSTSVPDLSLTNFDTTPKASPERYRRVQRRADSSTSVPTTPQDGQPPNRSAMPSGSGMANVAHLYNGNLPPVPRPAHLRTNSADDMQLGRQATEQAKRYRRRSLNSFEANAMANQVFTAPNGQPQAAVNQAKPQGASESRPAHYVVAAGRPPSHHERHPSAESVSSNSARSRPSSKQENIPQRPSSSSSAAVSSVMRQETRATNAASRGNAEANKRMPAPSPLSKAATTADAEQARTQTPPTKAPVETAPAAAQLSPAAQHLQAVSNNNNKNMKSRLRRAFSFGSAAELRRGAAENNVAKSKKEKTPEEIEAEHEAIAAKQEAAGIGAGIYSGQHGFSSSTDNLSISSTASSASIMLRKMGKGMKKGTKSIRGLFRPKSVVGVPAADGPLVEPTVGQVSMVTVEAEREKVNVNANPSEQVGGGTGFPKLERNSIDAASVAKPEAPGSSNGPNVQSDAWARRSIVGGERERAEVLAAVKKGILKRTATSPDAHSPLIRPIDGGLPGITHGADTPNSSAPPTPADDQPRLTSMGNDYFAGGPRFPNNSTKSLPNSPSGPRNISFNSRLQFHDVWSATEYDRRGDIATCNRLTPMLAQQIKEELNSFKMVSPEIFFRVEFSH